MKKTAAIDTSAWDSAIELRNVVKYFDQSKPISLFRKEKHRIFALNDVSFSISKGEFVAYAGPNGAGKSTTFKLLCGMLKPQQGAVRLFGMDPNQNRIPIMRKTGILFGNRSELWWDHPIRASFEWKKAVWAIEDSTYARICDEMKALLGIGEFWNTFARELSLGQRMRADLALTLLHEPELVLLDEPTLGLDVLAKRQMIEFLQKINREKCVTLLVTSHDMDDLTEMANRILLINHGSIAFDGGYDELIKTAGDLRILKLSLSGDAPNLPGTTYMGTDGGKHLYRYDAGTLFPQRLFGMISAVPDVQDAELCREDIEQVIARLYQRWQKTAD